MVALAVRYVLYPHALGLIGFWFLFLLLFGIHLFRPETRRSSGPVTRRPVCSVRYLVRDTLVFLLDPVALSFSYYLAYVLRFRTTVPDSDLRLFLHSLPHRSGSEIHLSVGLPDLQVLLVAGLDGRLSSRRAKPR